MRDSCVSRKGGTEEVGWYTQRVKKAWLHSAPAIHSLCVDSPGKCIHRHAALPCFSPTNIELSIAMNSPDDFLLLSWLHSV